jgi:hypothetical protein
MSRIPLTITMRWGRVAIRREAPGRKGEQEHMANNASMNSGMGRDDRLRRFWTLRISFSFSKAVDRLGASCPYSPRTMRPVAANASQLAAPLNCYLRSLCMPGRLSEQL